MTTRSPSPTPKRRSLLSKLRLATWRQRFEWLIAVLFVAVVACWIFARMTPSWYAPLSATDDNVMRLAGRAQTLLYFELRNTAERVPLGEQRWTITQDEINSFLAVNTAPQNAEGGGGSGGGMPALADSARTTASDPFVVFTKGQVTVCARISKLPSPEPQGGVGSLTFSVGVVNAPDGKPMGQVKLMKVWAGNMPVPRSLLEPWMAQQIPGMAEAVQRMAQLQFGVRGVVKTEPILQQIVQSIGEGRPFPLQYKVDNKEFLIKELSVDDGSLTVVLAPLKPAAVLPRPTSAP
jgi:hypothetical protein